MLNPVIQVATVAWSLRKLPCASDATETHAFYQNSELSKITQTEILDYLRPVARSIRKDKLGVDPIEIGCKSMGSGTAMGWHLAGHRAGQIMLMGRWKSDVFISYLRRHVFDFCRGISKSLLQHEFFVLVMLLEPALGILDNQLTALPPTVLVHWLPFNQSSPLTLPSTFTRFISLV